MEKFHPTDLVLKKKITSVSLRWGIIVIRQELKEPT